MDNFLNTAEIVSIKTCQKEAAAELSFAGDLSANIQVTTDDFYGIAWKAAVRCVRE